jgi:hypothetical protein
MMTQDPRIWKSLASAFSLSLCQEFFHQLYNIVLFKDNGRGPLGKMQSNYKKITRSRKAKKEKKITHW